MTISRKMGTVALAAVIGLAGLELGASIGVPGLPTVVDEAFARVGRPLTPVSAAGAARRTVRRCAAGVYTC
ncbi:hypothetical protein PRN20_06110 [Devosia sp. ZB163]|jgi:hypothetical protein|uniref:hypothetical protein n=1 Tax=Devosia sp. ZB163 TaxID=3025938 RepID=UPI00235F079A|nr:hypothetical protein [Devosia sp. ZB163]MDC9823298.1 hypothetical protein [Devosia sp. ZB163]